MAGLDEILEARELGVPERAVVFQPAVDFAQRLRIEIVETMSSGAVFADQAGLTKEAKMLGDGRPGNREGAGDLTGGSAALTQEVQDGAAGGIGESAEDRVARMRSRMVSHNM